MEIHPNPARVSMTSTNLKNASSQVLVTIDGVKYTLSPRLTKDFREKKVSVDQLGEYYVREVEGSDGTHFLSLGYPSEDISIKITAWKGQSISERNVSVEELMELVAL